ncbi:MAG: ATP-binding cassette domain-containing protein, partial [Deltaproteobacteria bacterium]|nr:ATP-binding cassette domain-containing protein [Deltaproteobacteria bacterium]
MAVKPVAPPAKTPSASAGHPVSDPSSVDSHDHSAGTPSPHSRDEARKRQPVAVQLQNVSLAFRGVAVLEDVTLDIRRGDFLAVLGPNGAGKSTLLKLIGGLLKPDQGAVTVFGQAAHLLGRGRARLGVMPQAGSVNESFPVTAAQVVMMGRFSQMGPGRFPRRGDREAVALALERSGAQNLALR